MYSRKTTTTECGIIMWFLAVVLLLLFCVNSCVAVSNNEGQKTPPSLTHSRTHVQNKLRFASGTALHLAASLVRKRIFHTSGRMSAFLFHPSGLSAFLFHPSGLSAFLFHPSGLSAFLFHSSGLSAFLFHSSGLSAFLIHPSGLSAFLFRASGIPSLSFHTSGMSALLFHVSGRSVPVVVVEEKESGQQKPHVVGTWSHACKLRIHHLKRKLHHTAHFVGHWILICVCVCVCVCVRVCVCVCAPSFVIATEREHGDSLNMNLGELLSLFPFLF